MEKTSIDPNNEELINATIHYNYKPQTLPELDIVPLKTKKFWIFSISIPDYSGEEASIYAAITDSKGKLLKIYKEPVDKNGEAEIDVDIIPEGTSATFFAWSENLIPLSYNKTINLE